jgi:hypothetical protein
MIERRKLNRFWLADNRGKGGLEIVVDLHMIGARKVYEFLLANDWSREI